MILPLHAFDKAFDYTMTTASKYMSAASSSNVAAAGKPHGNGYPRLVMCWLGLEATGHAWLGLALAKPGQANAWLGLALAKPGQANAWLELASGSGLGFGKPEAMAQAMACVTIQ